jgi:L-threonylcarbamoyladenylate synthase
MSDDPIEEAVRVLNHGGIVCFPTETYYGLAVDALDERAVAHLVEVKGREDRPIATILFDLSAGSVLWRELSPALAALAARHWPGPLTLVAPALPEVPRALVGPGGGVGARVSSHPLARALARFGPITATSANRAGAAPACTIDQARSQFGDLVDFYLDGGETPGGAPSTVVEAGADGRPRVIRAGAVEIATDG